MNMEGWWRIFRQLSSRMRKTRRRGVATAEMALLLPLMVMLLLGVIDFGRIFYEAMAVVSAARASVSYGENLSQDTEISVTVERFCECADGSLVSCSSVCASGPSLVYVKATAEKTFRTLIPYPGIPDPVTIRRIAYMRAR